MIRLEHEDDGRRAMVGRVPVEPDPWADPLGGGFDGPIDRKGRAERYARTVTDHVKAVEQAAHHLQGIIDTAKLARIGGRAEVERVRDQVAATFADLLAAMAPGADAKRERLVDRLLAQARGGE